MTYPAFGVWEGKVYDYRKHAPAEALPVLSGLDDFEPGNTTRAFIADRGFLVFDPEASLIEAFSQYMNQAARESCGRCTPCRVGTQRIRDLLDEFGHGRGKGREQTLKNVEEIARQVTLTSLCGMGQSCAKALLQALRHFPEEFKPRPPEQRADQHSYTYTTAPCIEVCPSKVDVPKYIDGVKGGKFDHALGVVLDKYSMVATCGRVCVRFCEAACRRNGAEGSAVGIRMLKRYAADQIMTMEKPLTFERAAVSHSERIAIIGAGPAGITCAYKLLLAGYQVDIYEAQRAAGGMASIGIPSYRLPKDVLKFESEDLVRHLGGQFFYGKLLGQDFSVDDLFAQGYASVFLGYGASQGTLLGVKNEDPGLQGYTSGVDFLLKVHKHVEYGEPYEIKGDVVVVGGGNVAMDCVRSAKRMGAKSVHLIYRRTLEDMPADHEEVVASEHEDIIFHCLTNPSALLVKDGLVTGVELVQMRQTERDARGRRSVEAIPGSESVMNCDLIIAAIGQQVDKSVLKPEEGIVLDRWNCITVDPDTLQTSRAGVFAGGDCVLGPLTLVNALDHGERAAASIVEYLQSGTITVRPAARMQKLLAKNKLLSDECLEVPPLRRERAEVPEQDARLRISNFEEVEGGLSKAEAYEEARRCLRCYRLYSIVTRQPLTAPAAGHNLQPILAE
ncbi:FAD-dependent oxidoreductase [Paludibacterium yongneupense]|uniref:FAD-dependent oxidoreductase n=1 Tax=Paludibacterium yongneupense TaxID=400061 RepID=UPI0003F80425|nr:FAD-dependent oxidoreductase [Paludibacterium yongneupense]